MTAVPLTFAPQAVMAGHSKIWVVEPQKSGVRAPRRRIVKRHEEWPVETDTLAKTTLGNAKSFLEIREWDFFTALTKTELAYPLQGDDPNDRAYGAYLQHRALLRWNSDNLRLVQQGVFSRKDSVRTSIAGRFGEALMYLQMVKSGYPYWDHLPSLAERLMEMHDYSREDKLRVAKVLSRPSRNNGKRVPEPDYAFETVAQEVALAEAKGAFVNPDDPPKTAKKGLSDGLNQLSLWQSHIAPTPQRCFAIGAYLREENDRHPDPSLLAVVDPEKENDGLRTLEFPKDWIRRGNYAAWMRGMGLYESAELLAYGRSSELPRRKFTTIEIAGRTFVIAPVRLVVSRRFRRLEDLFLDFFPDFFPLFLPWCDVHVLGIERGNVSFIEKAVNVPSTALPNEMTIQEIAVDRFPDWFSGSIMPDGTLNAILHFDDGKMRKMPLGTAEFRL